MPETEPETSLRLVLSEQSVAEFMQRNGPYVWASNDPYEMVWRITGKGHIGTTRTLILVPWDNMLDFGTEQ